MSKESKSNIPSNLPAVSDNSLPILFSRAMSRIKGVASGALNRIKMMIGMEPTEQISCWDIVNPDGTINRSLLNSYGCRSDVMPSQELDRVHEERENQKIQDMMKRRTVTMTPEELVNIAAKMAGNDITQPDIEMAQFDGTSNPIDDFAKRIEKAEKKAERATKKENRALAKYQRAELRAELANRRYNRLRNRSTVANNRYLAQIKKAVAAQQKRKNQSNPKDR